MWYSNYIHVCDIQKNRIFLADFILFFMTILSEISTVGVRKPDVQNLENNKIRTMSVDMGYTTSWLYNIVLIAPNDNIAHLW